MTQKDLYQVKLELACYFCDASIEIEVPSLPGRDVRYGVINEDLAFCPEHAKVEEFLQDQCPGCVACFGDCGLSRSIQDQTIPEGSIASIKSGVCPYRVNGTFRYSDDEGFDELDISNTSLAGEALAEAIDAYNECQG